jgi:hypothetical protein
MGSKWRLSLPASSLLLSACMAANTSLPLQADDEADNLWQKQGIVRYSYTVERACFCLPDYTRPMRVSIDGEKLVKAVYVDDGKPVPADIRSELKTMTQWLQHVEKLEAEKPHRLNVQLDAETGHLLRFDVDHHPRIADDELTVIISDFSTD